MKNAKFTRESRGSTSVSPQKFLRELSQSTSVRNISERLKIEQFSMKLFIDEHDDVIDVNLLMSSFFSSLFASSMSSLKIIHIDASNFNDSFMYDRTSAPNRSVAESSSSNDVAGWLKTYHQDFALQAMRPYERLEQNIRRSIRVEVVHAGTYINLHSANDKRFPWIEVCITLIVNAQIFSVRQLFLRRRLVFSKLILNEKSLITITIIEKEIFSESVMNLNVTLIDVVERVLAQSS